MDGERAEAEEWAEAEREEPVMGGGGWQGGSCRVQRGSKLRGGEMRGGETGDGKGKLTMGRGSEEKGGWLDRRKSGLRLEMDSYEELGV